VAGSLNQAFRNTSNLLQRSWGAEHYIISRTWIILDAIKCHRIQLLWRRRSGPDFGSYDCGPVYTLLFGGILGLIGAIFQVAAHEIGLFFAGRVLAGVSSGIMLTTVAIYQSEIAPPAVRGRMVAFQNMSLSVAGLLASLVGFAGNFAHNMSIQW